jgi:maleylacetoacetate isomerase
LSVAQATLYAYWRSSASWRVRIALYWKQIPFEYKAVHLVKNGGEQFSAAYSELNPMKLVPTLLIDSHVLTESRAIIEYLEETRPEHPLLPKDPYLRAKARQLADIVTSDTQPLQNLRVLNKLTADFGASQEQKNAWARHWIDTSFQGRRAVL